MRTGWVRMGGEERVGEDGRGSVEMKVGSTDFVRQAAMEITTTCRLLPARALPVASCATITMVVISTHICLRYVMSDHVPLCVVPVCDDPCCGAVSKLHRSTLPRCLLTSIVTPCLPIQAWLDTRLVCHGARHVCSTL